MKKIFLMVVLLLYVTSCATQQFKVSNQEPKSAPNYKESQTFFVYGIGQTKQVNTSEICGGDNKVTQVENKHTPLDIFIGFVQGALIGIQIYSPRTTSVTCK